MAETPGASIADALRRAAAAYDALADRAEEVDDEWQYIEDLRAAYLPSIHSLETTASTDPTAAVAAIDELVVEIEAIVDPHKAIDWLSTFPHVVALAVGGSVDDATTEAGYRPAPDGPDEPDEPDDDSPFRILLRGGR